MPRGKKELDVMSPESRVWIYQTNRRLQSPEATQIRERMSSFIKGWKAHGNELMAGCTITKNHFLIIVLDESYEAASGCSIDACVREIQEVGRWADVDFLDRSNVATLSTDNEVKLVPLDELKEAVQQGEITPDTLIFDNSVQKLKDFKSRWIIPASESWIKRYFK